MNKKPYSNDLYKVHVLLLMYIIVGIKLLIPSLLNRDTIMSCNQIEIIVTNPSLERKTSILQNNKNSSAFFKGDISWVNNLI